MRPAKPILLALTLTLTLPAVAQTTPTLKVYSRETIVDVTVTDSKGQPIHGLTKEDFTLKEDGKPQPIRSFEEFSNRPDAPPAPHKLPANVYTNLQPPPSSSTVNILLLDGLNMAPNDSSDPMQVAGAFSNQTRVKVEAKKYLDTMPPGTSVAVFEISNHLRILQGFTSDPALLRASVDTMQINLDGRANNKEAICSQRDAWNKATLESFNQIAAYVSGIKGRKNLIWLTIPAASLTDPAARPSCMPDYAPDLNKAYDRLMSSQVSVYPIDGRGLTGAGGGVKGAQDLLSMESIAEATSGIAYYNTNDLASAIGNAVYSGSNYYTLSYVPPSTAYDGRHHTINIKVAQPGLKLVYRQGYYAEDPTAIAVNRTLTLATTPPEPQAGNMNGAMARGAPTSAQLLFDVKVEPSTELPQPSDPPIMGSLDPKLKDKPLTRYGFLFLVPSHQIAFAPGADDTHSGALDFDIAAYDAQGKLLTSLSQTMKFPLTNAEYQQFLTTPFQFYQQLDLPSAPLFLRIGILDATANKTGTLEIPLTVPKK